MIKMYRFILFVHINIVIMYVNGNRKIQNWYLHSWLPILLYLNCYRDPKARFVLYYAKYIYIYI